MVVLVLMISCHVSLNPKIGPLSNHKRISPHAPPKAAGCPTARAIHLEKWPNRDTGRIPPIRRFLYVQPRIKNRMNNRGIGTPEPIKESSLPYLADLRFFSLPMSPDYP